MGHAALANKVVNITDAYDDPGFNRTVDEKTGYRTRAILAAPIRTSDHRVVGVMEVMNKIDPLDNGPSTFRCVDTVRPQTLFALNHCLP